MNFCCGSLLSGVKWAPSDGQLQIDEHQTEGTDAGLPELRFLDTALLCYFAHEKRDQKIAISQSFSAQFVPVFQLLAAQLSTTVLVLELALYLDISAKEIMFYGWYFACTNFILNQLIIYICVVLHVSF